MASDAMKIRAQGFLGHIDVPCECGIVQRWVPVPDEDDRLAALLDEVRRESIEASARAVEKEYRSSGVVYSAFTHEGVAGIVRGRCAAAVRALAAPGKEE